MQYLTIILHYLLAPVELADLQDLCRQEVRLLLRANIEHEHPDLATAANKPVQKRSTPRDRRQIRRIVVPYVPVPPFYESDDDPRMVSDEESEERDDGDGLYDQRHTANQISAFLELARSLAGQRRLNREGDDDDEDDDEDEDEGRETQQEDRDVDLEGLEEDKEEDDNDKYAHTEVFGGSCPAPEHPSLSEPAPLASLSETNHTTSDTAAEGNHSPQTSAEPASRTAAATEANHSTRTTVEPKCTTKTAAEVNHSAEVAAIELGNQMVSCKEKTDKGEGQKSTESFKDPVEPLPSVSALTHSDPIPMTSTPIMPMKCSKKREKFDSGVGDEIENGKGPSSDSDQGDDADIDMDIDSSDSDYSDNSAPRTKFTRLLDPDDPNCACGGGCGEAFKARRGEEDESKTAKKESAAETYSTHMREKINLLPLPQALKLYLNYNREL